MKVLEIENNNGFYILKDKKINVIEINKEDIYLMLDIIFENEDIEMDIISEEFPILNDAQKTIYENVYTYFSNFISNKSDLQEEIEKEFESILIEIEKDIIE